MPFLRRETIIYAANKPFNSHYFIMIDWQLGMFLIWLVIALQAKLSV